MKILHLCASFLLLFLHCYWWFRRIHRRPCGITLFYHDSEVKRRGVQESKNINYAKQHHTPHCWLPAKVMYPANSTLRFSWLTRSTSILLMKNVQVYIMPTQNFANWHLVEFSVLEVQHSNWAYFILERKRKAFSRLTKHTTFFL